MMNLLDLLYIPTAVVLAPLWALKKRRGWPERLGKIAPLPSRRKGTKARILLHAVSVGEVSALRHLVPLLAGDFDVVVSVSTDTGLARACALYAGSCHVVRYPLDLSWCVGRFLDAVRPDVVGLVELEVWPNFVRACERAGVPVAVVNGRLSERSFRGYRRIRPLIAPSFGRLAAAGVQDESYAARFEALGVPRGRVRITGSMKWDAASIADHVPGAQELGAMLGIDPARPLIVAGSTGPDDEGGEEALLHAACPAGAQLLCAPRKPERFDEAARAMPGCVRRSACSPDRPAPVGADRFLLDSIGELRQAYSLADVVVVGRSFGGLYGSDPIEPVALGKPTVIGPSVKDFEAVVGSLERAGGLTRATRETLGAVLGALVDDPEQRRTIAERGRACIRGEQGASERTAGLLRGVVEGKE